MFKVQLSQFIVDWGGLYNWLNLLNYMSLEIIRRGLTLLRAVLIDVYHREQRSLGYHFQVILFRSA